VTDSTAGSAMCTLCGFAAPIETEFEGATASDAMKSVVLFALHFIERHPEIPGDVNRYLVMTPNQPG